MGGGGCERWARIEFDAGAGLGRWGMRALVVTGFLGRLRGLLGTNRDDERAVPLVHKFGMRYQLDVVLVEEGGLVLGSWRELPAGRVVRCAGARHALERPSCGEPWPVVGDRVELRDMWHVMGA